MSKSLNLGKGYAEHWDRFSCRELVQNWCDACYCLYLSPSLSSSISLAGSHIFTLNSYTLLRTL